MRHLWLGVVWTVTAPSCCHVDVFLTGVDAEHSAVHRSVALLQLQWLHDLAFLLDLPAGHSRCLFSQWRSLAAVPSSSCIRRRRLSVNQGCSYSLQTAWRQCRLPVAYGAAGSL
jgi:hypothetical protein